MKGRRVLWAGASLIVLALGATLARAVPALPDRKPDIPSTRVVRGPLKLTVYATGELRAGRTATLVAPPAGGTLRIVKLVPTGSTVKAGEVVFEIDPSDQEFTLAQAKSELAEAEQQIVKMKADAAVKAAEDEVALLTARYDVRRGELDTAANDLIGAIDAQKNVLTLAGSPRASGAASGGREGALGDERSGARGRARAAEQGAARDAARAIDHRQPGGEGAARRRGRGQGKPRRRRGLLLRPDAARIPPGRHDVRRPSDCRRDRSRPDGSARQDQRDRSRQPAERASWQSSRPMLFPAQTFKAKVGALSGLASRDNFFETTAVRQFDVTFTFDNPDPRLRAGSTVRLVIDGREITRCAAGPAAGGVRKERQDRSSSPHAAIDSSVVT